MGILLGILLNLDLCYLIHEVLLHHQGPRGRIRLFQVSFHFHPGHHALESEQVS